MRVLGVMLSLTLVACSPVKPESATAREDKPAAASQQAAASSASPRTEVPAEPWPEGTKVTKGSALPDTPLKRLEDGASFDLASLRGKPVLLNVWATWCTPCRAETPELDALSRSYSARGLEVIGVSVDDASTESKAIADFVKEEKAGYRMLRQPNGELMDVINTPALPATVLLDKNGAVQWIRIGPLRHDDPRVVAAIEKVL